MKLLSTEKMRYAAIATVYTNVTYVSDVKGDLELLELQSLELEPLDFPEYDKR